MYRHSGPLLGVVGVCALLTGGVLARQAIDTPDLGPPRAAGPSTRSTPLPTIAREIRWFDFEERTLQPHDFPIGFYRIGPAVGSASDTLGQARPGHPLFGEMLFSDHMPHSGLWSFSFDLQGGSMAAAVAPDTIPIIPGGDYLITAWVRTEGLEHARARVSAVFYDRFGHPIPESSTHTELLRTRGAWQEVSIELLGRFSEAADLIVELQLLQPSQFKSVVPGVLRPVLEDVEGRVWFDDVAIWHMPRVHMGTNHPGNVIVAPELPELSFSVSDLSSEPIAASLVITDLSGNAIHQEHLEVRRGRMGHRVPLASLPFGWYRADLTLTSSTRRLGHSHLEFAYVPALGPSPPSRRNTFGGVDLEDVPLSDLAVSADLIDRLGIGLTVLPAWDRQHLADGLFEHATRMRPGIDHLLDADVDVVLSIPFIPGQIARELALDEAEVVQMFQDNPEKLRPVLEQLLVQFGQRVQYWQLGRADDPDNAWRDDLTSAVDQVWRELARLVPGPLVMVPWSIHQPLAPPTQSDQARMGYHVVIPYEVQPDRFDPSIMPTSRSSESLMYSVQQLPRGRFDRHQRAIDTVFRAIHARAAGLSRVMLESPWTSAGDAEHPVMPDPSLPGWIIATRMLHGRTFAGEVPFRPGVKCLLFDGEGGPVLVAWRERANRSEAVLHTQLASQDVQITDMAGNSRHITPIDGRHRLLLFDEPVFIQGIDPDLARFRQGFRIESAYARSVPRDHQHELVVRNPWDVALTGNLRLLSPENWRFSPRRMPFSIPARGEVRLPFTLTFPRTEPAGDKQIEVEFNVSHGEAFSFRATAHFEVGLPYLEVEPTWRAVRSPTGTTDDIIVSAYITNTGSAPMSLEAFLLAPDYQRMRRSISRLEPGETVRKSFYLPAAAARLGGETVRIGVGQIDNPERLIRTITFPFPPPSLTTEDGSG